MLGLLINYVTPGSATTLDTLNALRSKLHSEICRVFTFEPAVISAQDDVKICTKQITSNGGTQWSTTGHAVVTFPTREAVIRVHLQQQLMATTFTLF